MAVVFKTTVVELWRVCHYEPYLFMPSHLHEFPVVQVWYIAMGGQFTFKVHAHTCAFPLWKLQAPK